MEYTKKLAKIGSTLGVLLILLFSVPSFALAHVVVSPSEVFVGKRLNFVVGVPTEKEIPTTSLRLIIPEGLESVRPLVKPGWRISIVKDEAEEKVTEIVWSAGSIPADQKDEFVVSAKAPAQAGALIWKAYQTYSDGSVVAWDLPAESEEEGKGPYSETKVIDDLDPEPAPASQTSSDSLPLYLSLGAVLLSVFALYKKRK